MNEHLLERIDRYLGGKMSAEEKAAFESEAVGNKELSSLLAIYSGIETEMRENVTYNDQEAALRQTLGRLNKAYFTDVPQYDTAQPAEPGKFYEAGKPEPGEAAPGDEEPAPRGKFRSMNVRRLLLVAAACIGIIVIGVKLWNITDKDNGGNNRIVRKKDSSASTPIIPGIPPDTQVLVQQQRPSQGKEDQLEGKPPVHKDSAQQRPSLRPMDRTAHTKPAISPSIDNTALFAANFAPDTAPAEKPSNLDIAFDYYENRDYKEAAKEFSTANSVTRGEDDKELIAFYRNYYLAQVYLAKNNAPKALFLLKSALLLSPNNSWKTRTQWYLALAHLKKGELQQAMYLLKTVSHQTQDATLRQKAGTLLAEMKKG